MLCDLKTAVGKPTAVFYNYIILKKYVVIVSGDSVMSFSIHHLTVSINVDAV
jgi:hypothetical protein